MPSHKQVTAAPAAQETEPINYNPLPGLLREDLRFTERTLSRRLGGHHFELSIFIGGAEPDIMSYYDSAGHDYPRSREARAANARYYRDNRYAVVELLDTEQDPLRIVSETRTQEYNYTSPEQASAIGSTVLYRFSNRPPAALVITCDKPDVFKAEDGEMTTFVRAAGMAFQGEILCSELLRGDQSERPAPGLDVKCELTWLHVSDLHFGAPPTGHRFDQRRVLAALLRDAARFAGVDYIFITGDLAFSGAGEQYEQAANWIGELANTVKAPLERVRLLPGNHDIHRDTVKKHPILQNAHESLRKDPLKLDDYLTDVDSRQILASKLAAYKEVLGKRFEMHPGLVTGDFDWAESLKTANNRDVKLVGLSTVWVSDEHDGGDSPNVSVEANMLLSGAQLSSTLDRIGNPEFLIILTHHPTTWLAAVCRNMLTQQAARHPHIHLCGHVHQAEGTLSRRLGDTTTSVTYVVGAAHGEPKDSHGYSWGALARTSDESAWDLGWAPRVYVRDRNEFRAESTRFDLDARDINWIQLKP